MDLYSLLFRVLHMIGKWLVFKKGGQKPWKSLIPVYSSYVEATMLNRIWFFIADMSANICYYVGVLLLLPILSPILIDPWLTGAPIDYTLSMETLLSVWYFIPAIIVVALALGVKLIVRIRKACRYGELMNLNGLIIFGLVVMPDVFTFLIGFSSKYQWKKNTLLL